MERRRSQKDFAHGSSGAAFVAALLTTCLVVAALAALPPPSVGSEQKGATWWAFVTPQKPPIPSIQNPKSKIQNPIDAFLLAKLEAKGLDFAPPADRRTLLRRAAFDLTGLPPTPEEVDAFLNDTRPNAYEKVIDRLLASPRYGERWGRHWLDVVRFGETDGGEHNYERFNAWPYRDYVIGAFNRDLPYDQFVREQIAGDILFPNDRTRIAATGFLVAGPWDQVSVELNKDPTMKKMARMDELDDMVTTTCSTFLALTVHCARCHDHKFDPIPSRDYYRFTAVFGGAGFGERGVATDEERARYDAQVKPLRAELDRVRRALAEIEAPVTARLLREKYRAFDAARRGERQRSPLNPLYNRNAFAPVTTRYVRLAITGQVGSKARIDRLDLLPANHTLKDWRAEATAQPDRPVYLTVNFGTPQTVSEIVWSTNPATGERDGMITLYRLEASDDGQVWRPLASSLDHVSSLEVDMPTLTEEEIVQALTPEERARRKSLPPQRDDLQSRLNAIPSPARLYAVAIRKPDKAFLLERGSVQKPGEEVTPGALSAVNQLPALFPLSEEADDAKRRLALADWITDPKNPLTARVLVNRVWYYHFGSGIVNTPSDFGLNGDRPSHPELLDWLAATFVAKDEGGRMKDESGVQTQNFASLHPSSFILHPSSFSCGWSLKKLHRLIMTSRAYRQSAAFNPKAHRIDAGNRLLWRMPLKRMDAETLRDSLLYVSGNLDLRAGGPGFLLHSKGSRGSYIYHALDNDGPEVWRRAVYRFVVRGGDRVLLDSFDCPDPSVATPQRTISNTPVQALTLMNNAFVIRQAELFAKRLEKEAVNDQRQASNDASKIENQKSKIRSAYRLAFGREPTAKESATGLRFLARHPLSLYCRALLNANEFVYVP